MEEAKPNAAHMALAKLEEEGKLKIFGIITVLIQFHQEKYFSRQQWIEASYQPLLGARTSWLYPSKLLSKMWKILWIKSCGRIIRGSQMQLWWYLIFIKPKELFWVLVIKAMTDNSFWWIIILLVI